MSSGTFRTAAKARVRSRKVNNPKLASSTSQSIAAEIQLATGICHGARNFLPEAVERAAGQESEGQRCREDGKPERPAEAGARCGRGGAGVGMCKRRHDDCSTSRPISTPRTSVRWTMPMRLSAVGDGKRPRGRLDLGGEVRDLAVRRDLAGHRVVAGRTHDGAGGEDLGAGRVAGEIGDIGVGRGQHQFLGGAGLDDAPVAHDGDAVGEPYRLVEVVGDEDDGLLQLRLQPQELVLHLAADQRVERGERLVEEPQLRTDRQRAGDADALLLAARKLARQVGLAALEADEGDHLARPRLALGAR